MTVQPGAGLAICSDVLDDPEGPKTLLRAKRCAALRIEPRVPMREPGFADQLAGRPDSIARQELADGTIVSTACFTSKSWVLHNWI